MKIFLSFAAATLGVLAVQGAVQAQHGHGHSHGFGYGGHVHGYGGHGLGFGYAGYGHTHYWPSAGYYGFTGYGYPYTTGTVWPAPTYSYPSVATDPGVPAVVPVVGVTSTSVRPNAIPPYTGPGVTLRLPAEFPGSVFVHVDKQEVEIKPGTEVVFKDKVSYRVEFDQGAEYGTSSSDVSEGVYRFAVGDRGWHLLPDAPAPANGGPRRNALPGDPKK